MSEYSIIEADVNNSEDASTIVNILRRNLSAQSEERFKWNYRNCPFGNARCWLAKDERTGEFVGTAGLFPRKFIFNGNQILTAIAADFAVDKKHRGFGPAFKLQTAIQSDFASNGTFFIYGIPNELAERLFLKVGYKQIGRFNKFVKVLRNEFKKDKLLVPYLFSPIFNFLVNIFSRELYYKKEEGFSMEVLQRFDERFDKLVNVASKQFTILGERTCKFLNWRYGESSTQDYKIFCVVNNGKDILAYLVYYLENNMCHIADVIYLKQDKILEILLANFLLFARKSGFGSISLYFFGNSGFEKKLKQFLFFKRNNENSSLMLYNHSRNIEQTLLDKENWHFLEGDYDI